MGNNIQIFGRTFSDVSSITVNNTSSSAVKYVQEPIFEDITISPDYLVEQNTVVNNGIIFQTDETYPGTPVVLNNTTVANIDNGDLGQNGIGIKIDLNKTYHCTGELKIEWSTGEQEIYSIDSDFTPTNYNSSVSLPNFSWKGIGTTTQTFGFMCLNFVSSSYNGYKIFMRPITGNTQITKSGVLLDGSYYQISVTSDGFNTINLNLSGDPRFQTIYKSLAYRSVIASSAPGVSEWCNSLSSIYSFQFAGQSLSGNFIFSNVSFVGQYAFAWNYIGGLTGAPTAYNLTFPILSRLYDNSPFGMNRGLTSIYCPSLTTIGSYIFYNCYSLTTISFPSCTSIGNYAFYNCYNLTTAPFPECTTIGNNAFYNCYNLTTISFPECTTITNQAFYSCSKLTSIYFPKCTTISANAFYNCYNLATISFPECTTISNNAFYNCSNLTTISFPSCTSIGSYAFYNCSKLTTVSFPSCTSISGSAFYNCSNLISISFPLCMTISGAAFSNCTALQEAYFPNCTIIGGSAFLNCHSLSNISFPNCTYIGTSAFYNCTVLTAANSPNCTHIGSSAFYSCFALTTANFSNCTYIGDYAFYNCSALTTVSFPSCTSIGSYAFNYCINLSSFYFMGSSIPSIKNTTFYNTTVALSTYLGYFGSIYVPASLLASYRTAQYWSIYSARIVGI